MDNRAIHVSYWNKKADNELPDGFSLNRNSGNKTALKRKGKGEQVGEKQMQMT